MHPEVSSHCLLEPMALSKGRARYMRATKWSGAKNAIKRLEETLLWRREFGLYDDERVTAENIEPEAGIGSVSFARTLLTTLVYRKSLASK